MSVYGSEMNMVSDSICLFTLLFDTFFPCNGVDVHENAESRNIHRQGTNTSDLLFTRDAGTILKLGWLRSVTMRTMF